MKADVTAQIHRNDDTPHMTIDLPPVLAATPGLWVGTTMATVMSTWLCQDSMIGATYVDTVTASMSLVSLGPTTMAVDCLTATLEDVTEQESEDYVQTQPSPPNVTGGDAIFPQQWQLFALTLCKTVLLRCSHLV